MSHNLIRFKTYREPDAEEHEDYAKVCAESGKPLEMINEADAKAWHLVEALDNGESTACGQIFWDYARDTKTVERGGITCVDCLEKVKLYKSIKL